MTKYKIGDKIRTSQDWHETYTGEIIGIRHYPHPYSTEPEPKKDLTWYRIKSPNGSFETTSDGIKEILK